MEFRRYPRSWHLPVLVLAGFLLVMATASSGRAAVGNPGIIPPQAVYAGLSYSEWQSRWWQWVF